VDLPSHVTKQEDSHNVVDAVDQVITDVEQMEQDVTILLIYMDVEQDGGEQQMHVLVLEHVLRILTLIR
jgi:hypothetical protein